MNTFFKSIGHIALIISILNISLALAIQSNPPTENTSAEKEQKKATEQVPPYLMPNAPTFDSTLEQFHKKFSSANPSLKLDRFHSVTLPNDQSHLLRTASKINPFLYSSAVIDRKNKKIKSLQLTYLPKQDPEHKGIAITLHYMSAIIHFFEPTLSLEQSQLKADELLEKGKSDSFYQLVEGSIRYVIVYGNEEEITFAIEPVKLSLLTQ